MTAPRLTRADLLTPAIAARMRPADRKALGIPEPGAGAAKADAMAERELQRFCERELTRRGIRFHHLSIRCREAVGYPDLTFVLPFWPSDPLSCLCRHGVPMAIELKASGGKLSPEQVDMLTGMQRNGWHVRIVRDCDTFRRVLAADDEAGKRV